ncbi:hypothetical protein KI387_035417, partial [Taxus chinensis]
MERTTQKYMDLLSQKMQLDDHHGSDAQNFKQLEDQANKLRRQSDALIMST